MKVSSDDKKNVNSNERIKISSNSLLNEQNTPMIKPVLTSGVMQFLGDVSSKYGFIMNDDIFYSQKK